MQRSKPLATAALCAALSSVACSGDPAAGIQPAEELGPGCDAAATSWTVWVTNQGIDTVTVLREAGAPASAQAVPSDGMSARHGDAPEALVLATIEVGRAPHNLTFSPDGKRAYVALLGTPPENGALQVIDTKSYQILATVEAGQKAHGVAVSPDGGEIWVANVASDNVTVIDAASLEVTHTIEVGDGPALVAFVAGGSKAYVSNGDGGTTSVVDVASHAVVKTIPTGKGAMGLVASSDGRLMFETEGLDDRVSAIDTQSDTVVNVLPFAASGKEPHGIARAGHRLLITNRTASSFSFVDERTLELVDAISVPGRPDIIGVSPSCDRAYMTLRDSPSLAVVDLHDRVYLDALSLASGDAGDDLHGVAVLPGDE